MNSSQRPEFRTTQWSVVAAAIRDRSDAGDALAALCESYWQPLYAFIRRSGHAAQDAEDLTQGFFSVVLEKGYLAQADRDRGRFRTFLLAAVKNFLAKQRDREQAIKRGGGTTTLSLDFRSTEQRYLAEPIERWTAEALFEREWALALLSQVLEEIERTYQQDGKAELFRYLKPTLVGGTPAAPYSDIAKQLSTTTGAVKVAVHRLRKTYRRQLCEAISATVGAADDVESERTVLLNALHGS